MSLQSIRISGQRDAGEGRADSESTANARRPRALMLVHTLDPQQSMESRLSWFRAQGASQVFDTTVICAVGPREAIQSTQFHAVVLPHNRVERTLMSLPGCYYLAYRLWHRRVLRLARRMHAERPFALVHHVSYCGFREPGECWRLGVPFVWGPVGGTQNVPWRFFGKLDRLGAVSEFWRNVANLLQIRYGLRCGRAMAASRLLLSANREVQTSLFKARKVDSRRQLETGICSVALQPRAPREVDRPLRILWAGRLECWKALPLLFEALAEVSKEIDFQLRVLGSGSRERRLRRLADRFGLQDRIEWMPLPPYDARDEHYRWADLFTFTSLRDTSGTGLLESLAEGVPVVGLDHQGARDILTEECAVKIPVETPEQVVAEFRDAIVLLGQDTVRLQQMSCAALRRAELFHWDRLHETMHQIYADIVGKKFSLSGSSKEINATNFQRQRSVLVGK